MVSLNLTTPRKELHWISARFSASVLDCMGCSGAVVGSCRRGASRAKSLRILLALLGIFLGLSPEMAPGEEPNKIILPTDNQGLLTGDCAGFYQYVQRDFEGQKSEPWEGGQYGFVRNPKRIGSQIIYTRFHAGIDIRPLHRDALGEPEDIVRAIAVGQVVYANTNPLASNYGRYVVIQHDFDGCPYFSLYAHLKTTSVSAGESVSQGAGIWVLGYSGEGIDRERAHVHLGLNLLMNGGFDIWFAKYFPRDGNQHGNYNGMNLVGIDIGRFYKELGKNPNLTIPEFLKEETVWYRVVIPASNRMDLLSRYPWLSNGQTTATAWEISFARSGVPLRIRPVETRVKEPTVVWVESSPFPQNLMTRGFLQGSGSHCTLTREGLRYIDLISPSE